MRMDRRLVLLGGASAAMTACARSQTLAPVPSDNAIGIVAPPNPHTFPLLLAMARDPALPVRLLPIANAIAADALLNSGEASAMLAMSYVAAAKRRSGAVADLRLQSLHFWRGFFLVGRTEITGAQQLREQTVVVSGPLGAGRGGGGDIIFRAAMRRHGLNPDSDMHVEYAPMADGVARVATGAAAAITLPSPGSTGLVLRSQIAQRPLASAIARLRGADVGQSVPLHAVLDYQESFPGFATFPAQQLPLGGLCVTERALADPNQRAAIGLIERAYSEASSSIMSDPRSVAESIMDLFEHFYAPLGSARPASEVFQRAIVNGDLVYRSDIALPSIRADLLAWLSELDGAATDAAFLAAD